MNSRRLFWLQSIPHVAALALLVGLAWAFWQDRLGLDPVGELTRRTGRYALVFLLLSLVPTVVAAVSGFKEVLRIRRAFGLYGFLYAGLHLLIFALADYGLNLGQIARAIGEGPRVLAGLAALLILLPLALTSTTGWARRLGKHWKRLHRLAYLAAGLAVLHYALNYKELRAAPVVAGAALLLLLVLRLPPLNQALAQWRRK